jgi:predicted membrane-bound spermidine synthase
MPGGLESIGAAHSLAPGEEPWKNPAMRHALYAVFFASGFSSLVFETLWFRQATLVFGSSVWASSLVLAAFMGGLALGNGLAAWRGGRLANPIAWYAGIEVLIGALGLLLVWVLPQLPSILAPLFRALLDQSWALNLVRSWFAFALLLIPATGMGATLPLLVGARARIDPDFGAVLGRLYGCNTLGAVAGTLAGEVALIEALGVLGTGVAAACISVAAGIAAFGISRRHPQARPARKEAAAAREHGGPGARRLLIATFVAGGCLLGLEVVWFRFLSLFLAGTNFAFGVMLAVVLAGLALGGLLAALVLRAAPGAHRHAGSLALLCGVATLSTYAIFSAVLGDYPGLHFTAPWKILRLSLGLMLAPSILSGLLFTFIGKRLREEIPGNVEAAGMLTLANTAGAMLGPLLAGFVLLPALGVERCVLVFAMAYAAVAPLAHPPRSLPGRRGRRFAFAACAAGLAAATALFPFGRMQEHFLSVSSRVYGRSGEEVVAVREGLLETIIYTRKEFLGRPLFYRLITNGYSMSGTMVGARRYMKLFAFWPLAIHPGVERALLISFGVGSTAEALTAAPEIQSIDVVDISHDILELSAVVFGADAGPLADPRVRVHVEDGRFFLQTTGERYDLVTAEPPPLKVAGVVNLYTEEYFRLIRDRLRPGGITTYWLPVHQLDRREFGAVVRAFCNVFDDCSLWQGSSLDWMLAGSREMAPATEERLRSLWREPGFVDELQSLGFETPEQLGATFLADAEFLVRLTSSAEPLTDDFPYRMSNRQVTFGQRPRLYDRLLNPQESRRRFLGSAWVRRIWPEALREGAGPYFAFRPFLGASFSGRGGVDDVESWKALHQILTRSGLVTLPLWRMGSSADKQRILEAIADGEASPKIAYWRGVRALAERRYGDARRHFQRVGSGDPALPDAAEYEVYAALLQDRPADVDARMAEILARRGIDRLEPGFRAWARSAFGAGAEQRSLRGDSIR